MGDAPTWRFPFETFIGTPVLGPVPWDTSVFVPGFDPERVLLWDNLAPVPESGPEGA